MSNALRQSYVTIDEYLAGEELATVRHEYVDGYIHAMAGASERHNRIVTNLVLALGPLWRAQDCRGMTSDMKVRVDNVVYYPDLMVVCDPNDTDPLVKTSPCLIVEVMSPSTMLTDRREKWLFYQRIAALQAYVLVSQDERKIETHRRVPGGWEQHFFYHGSIALECPKGELHFDDVYADL